MNGAETLLEDYNDYRFRTHHIQQLRQNGQNVHSLGRKRLSAFEGLQEWCAEHQVDARRWLCSLFEARRWLFAPPLNQLKSKKHLKRYSKMDTIPVFRNRIQQERQTRLNTAGEVFDPNRDLSASAETLKRRYLTLSTYDRCIEKMDDETYGYHPRSTVCQECPAQHTCSTMLQAKVGFDIMALRRGQMTAEQAQAVIYYGRGH